MVNNTSHIERCHFSSLLNRIDAFIFIFISLASIVGHTIIFVAYSRHRVLRSTTNVFLISLSGSDVIVALFAVPVSFGVFLCGILPEEDGSTMYNYIYRYVDMLSSVVSIYSLSLISIDRAVAVSAPFIYRKYMNQKVAFITVFVTWIVIGAAVFLQLALTLKQFTLLAIIVAYAIPVAIMVVSYVVIGYVAKKHAKDINQLERTATRLQNSGSYRRVQAENVDDEKPLQMDGKAQKERTMTQTSIKWLPGVTRASNNYGGVNMKCLWREVKCAVKLSFILTCFVASWTPFMVLNVMQYQCDFCNGIALDLVKYFKILHYSNSALNPLLYILLNKTWKRAFKVTVCCGTKLSERNQTLSSSAGTC